MAADATGTRPRTRKGQQFPNTYIFIIGLCAAVGASFAKWQALYNLQGVKAL